MVFDTLKNKIKKKHQDQYKTKIYKNNSLKKVFFYHFAINIILKATVHALNCQ